MNQYISAQIFNMIAMARTFEQSCRLAATKDDGQIDKQEEKMLGKIHDATARFIRELERIK